MEFSKIEDAIEDIRQGKMILVVDDENRENEGDLVIAADKITPEAINFMAVHARGLICLPMRPRVSGRVWRYWRSSSASPARPWPHGCHWPSSTHRIRRRCVYRVR